MNRQKETLEIANVQYAKQQLDDGQLQLHINGHINNQYYETTVIISNKLFSDTQDFESFLRTSLISAREKTQTLREK